MAEAADPLAGLKRILRYLAAHPDSSATAIGRALGIYDRDVFHTLDNAAYEGICQRHKEGRASAWLWEICPDGLSLIDEGQPDA